MSSKYARSHTFICHIVDIYSDVNRISERESKMKVWISMAAGSQDSKGHAILI